MTVNEKTHLLSKMHQKPLVIPIPQEDLNNNNAVGLTCEYDSYALSRDELAKYIVDPFWTRVRYLCFSAYWLLCIVALIISCCIAFSALDHGFCEAGLNGDNNRLPTNNLTTTVLQISTTTGAPTTIDAGDSSGVMLRMLNKPI
ncbi:uncharacterized protein LOC129762397 [Toxorhynchites rutilus septentrionalis]|uniref:uncharacterized protein LOC129762397 n=1 Tax=Toxorhynchites rutilus septentrionalis TaxID=329112 RepID=UPI00247AF614|nr:uncharacterized protein LOC129762397 [Toxorhynchites rutilus septentrionalis]